MKYKFDVFAEGRRDVLAWLKEEYMNIQSGQISPSFLRAVRVLVYEKPTELSHCAVITAEGPKTLSVVPYDSATLPDIESSLRGHLSSMDVVVSDNTIRVIAPDMSGEQREVLKKAVKERAEEARQSIRSTREKVLGDIKKKKEDGELSENEEFNAKAQLQEEVDAVNREIEDLCKGKIEDIQM